MGVCGSRRLEDDHVVVAFLEPSAREAARKGNAPDKWTPAQEIFREFAGHVQVLGFQRPVSAETALRLRNQVWRFLKTDDPVLEDDPLHCPQMSSKNLGVDVPSDEHFG